VCGPDGPWRPPELLEVGEGGSTLRFLAPVLAARAPGRRVRLLARGSLARRPQDDLVSLLRAAGAEAHWERVGDGACLEVCGGADVPRSEVELRARTSSQPLSGLLMAAGERPLRLVLTQPPPSWGYLELTLRWLERFRGAGAVGVAWDGAALTLEVARRRGRGGACAVPGDASAAVFFATAAAVTGREVAVSGYDPEHPDARFLLACAERFGAWEVADTVGEVRFRPRTTPRADEVVLDLDSAPDAGPALAVLAALAPASPSRGVLFRGLGRLRAKESDRVAAMRRLAEACGAAVAVEDEGAALRIVAARGRAREGRATAEVSRVVAADGDHRVAMAVGVASLVLPGLRPDDPECVRKSFPDFWEALEGVRKEVGP